MVKSSESKAALSEQIAELLDRIGALEKKVDDLVYTLGWRARKELAQRRASAAIARAASGNRVHMLLPRQDAEDLRGALEEAIGDDVKSESLWASIIIDAE